MFVVVVVIFIVGLVVVVVVVVVVVLQGSRIRIKDNCGGSNGCKNVATEALLVQCVKVKVVNMLMNYCIMTSAKQNKKHVATTTCSNGKEGGPGTKCHERVYHMLEPKWLG
ncbi:unnamed protein product [Polarella glacialis]|uniref:Uncharacterized protein n=1 Tax=Polarella glacialis TaxID=89957 RepID=A0A813IL64_POLGL|nr:unnamed protein product [Polarella glacialis]